LTLGGIIFVLFLFSYLIFGDGYAWAKLMLLALVAAGAGGWIVWRRRKGAWPGT
jgi:hypothetical protein